MTQTTAAKKATAKERREAAEAQRAERRTQLLAQREEALICLLYQADSVQAAAAAIETVVRINLALAGVDDKLEVRCATSYNSYCPRGTGMGFLDVRVAMEWAKLASAPSLRVREMLEGLPVERYHLDDENGRPLVHRTAGKAVCLGIKFEQADGPLKGKDLVQLKAALAQQKALSTALEALRTAQGVSGVSQLLQKADSADARLIRQEQALAKEIEELEARLTDLREELDVARQRAEEVRARLKSAPSPASKVILEQLNQVRARLGMPPAK